jgi:hypothetical protein
MNFIKTKYKSRLSEADLSESLRAVPPNYNFDFKKFRSQMQCHPSYLQVGIGEPQCKQTNYFADSQYHISPKIQNLDQIN